MSRPRLTGTYTFVKLEVSRAAYDEIAAKLRAADYGHVFLTNYEGEKMDMHGIALQAEKVEGEQPAGPWRCFQCDEVFTDAKSAGDHFGVWPSDVAACRVEGGMAAELERLRQETVRLQRQISEEDTPLYRQLRRQESEHSTALLREEEKGYARGVRDARAEANGNG